MWVAKPLISLSQEERAAWCGILAGQLSRGREAPLAQTLAWGHAIEAVSGKVYVVFSPEESAGGLVFATAAGAFECINGPLLEWDDPAAAMRQLALFSTAVARLSSAFASLTLRPRWPRDAVARRLQALPVPVAGTTLASTLRIALEPGSEPEAAMSPRLRRTLRASERAGVRASWEEISSPGLVEFAVAAQGFGRERGFTVPPVFWFRALTQGAPEGVSFGLVRAEAPNGQAGCQLLIASHGGEAHYLFGHEWRAPGFRAAVSPSAIAHRLAIRKAREAGLTAYDLNGYLEDAAPDHPYAGVSAFKAQFGGTLVRYEVPEFKICP